MLALTRQAGQRIMIDTGKSKITIQVIRLRGKQVVLGIDAPLSIQIHREEIYPFKKTNWKEDFS